MKHYKLEKKNPNHTDSDLSLLLIPVLKSHVALSLREENCAEAESDWHTLKTLTPLCTSAFYARNIPYSKPD